MAELWKLILSIEDESLDNPPEDLVTKIGFLGKSHIISFPFPPTEILPRRLPGEKLTVALEANDITLGETEVNLDYLHFNQPLSKCIRVIGHDNKKIGLFFIKIMYTDQVSTEENPIMKIDDLEIQRAIVVHEIKTVDRIRRTLTSQFSDPL